MGLGFGRPRIQCHDKFHKSPNSRKSFPSTGDEKEDVTEEIKFRCPILNVCKKFGKSGLFFVILLTEDMITVQHVHSLKNSHF